MSTDISNNTIDIAVLCQEYSSINLTCNDANIVELNEISIEESLFKKLFYGYDGESFGIDQQAYKSSSLFPYISFLPEYRSTIDSSFSLVETIYSNIEQCLNISRTTIDTSSQIQLNKEISSIKSLCQLNTCSLISSLRWSDIKNIIYNDTSYNSSSPLILCITTIFKSPTEGVTDVVIKFYYSVTNFVLPELPPPT